MRGESYDLVLVGGGLQNGLIALACTQRRPGIRLALVEREAQLGGNHTWAVHALDVPATARAIVEPLIAHRWPGYDVRFPGLSRTIRAPYAATGSPRFAAVVGAALARTPDCRLALNRAVTKIQGDHVELAGGERLYAPLVVDARGPDAERPGSGAGYQKFLGLELELSRAHGLERPMLIDADVEQTDGFRFFYVLPLSPTRLLVEDTVFSRSAALDLDRARAEVLRYAARFGAVKDVTREERGCLPMPWRATCMAARAAERGSATALPSPLVAGYRGGWFHPATGYSFPVALRLACELADQLAGATPDRALGPALQALAREHARQARFARLLNRLLFHGFPAHAMRNVFERFYTLPEPLIHRFYALALTPLDRARILLGRPPRGLSFRHARQHALSRSS